MKNQSGIYQIINTINGKRYVGSAKNFRIRWNHHRSALVRGDHHSWKLSRAWGKCEADQFEFQILLLCDKKDLVFFEQRALDVMRPFYNVNPVADSRLGAKSTATHKKRISEAHKGKKYSEERRQQIRQTILDMNMGVLYTWGDRTMTLREWSKATGISHNVLQHRIRTDGSIEAAIKKQPATMAETTAIGHAASRAAAKRFEHKGRSLSISEWAKEYGVCKRVLQKKVYRQNKSVGEALEEVYVIKKITFKGFTRTVTEWAIVLGLTTNIINGRINRGWSVEDTLTKPRRGSK